MTLVRDISWEVTLAGFCFSGTYHHHHAHWLLLVHYAWLFTCVPNNDGYLSRKSLWGSGHCHHLLVSLAFCYKLLLYDYMVHLMVTYRMDGWWCFWLRGRSGWWGWEQVCSELMMMLYQAIWKNTLMDNRRMDMVRARGMACWWMLRIVVS